MFLLYCLHCFLSRIIDKCSRPTQRYIAKTSHIRLPTHLDDQAYVLSNPHSPNFLLETFIKKNKHGGGLVYTFIFNINNITITMLIIRYDGDYQMSAI